MQMWKSAYSILPLTPISFVIPIRFVRNLRVSLIPLDSWKLDGYRWKLMRYFRVHGETYQGDPENHNETQRSLERRISYDLVIFRGDAPVSFDKKEEHGVHLKLELELLRKEKLYAKVTSVRQ
ncbi:hypothetical protein Tco_1301524 [Tanacetum coccineum]